MSPTMPDTSYSILFRSSSVWYNLRVNDLFTFNQGELEPENFVLPIDTSMRSGTNRVSFNFVPILGVDEVTGEYLTGPKPDFFARVDIRTGTDERISLFDIRYDMETGELVNVVKDQVGPDPNFATERLSTNATIEVEEGTVSIGDDGSIAPSITVHVSFDVKDAFSAHHWLDGQQLTDTPALRRGLRAAYLRIHDQIQRGDAQAYFQEVTPSWNHAAWSMGYREGAEKWAEFSEHWATFGSVLSDGRSLAPLRVNQDPSEDTLEFSGNGRLVRIRPNPILFKKEGIRSVSMIPLVFYLTPAGEWRIANIAT